MLLGTTYSHREINYLKLDQNQSFLELLDLKFDVIRLCAYWSEIEKVNGAYNFQILTNMLDTCEQRQQKVLLVVGMKSPRWPEYFIPGWIQAASVEQARSHASMFIQQAVQHLQKYSCIVAWQVENEPLDPSGPQKWNIPLSILEEEVALVKQLDPDRPVHLTAWGNELTRRQTFAQITEIADSIGLDLYYKVPQTRWMYSGPKDSDKTLKLMIQNANKPVWITELQ